MVWLFFSILACALMLLKMNWKRISFGAHCNDGVFFLYVYDFANAQSENEQRMKATCLIAHAHNFKATKYKYTHYSHKRIIFFLLIRLLPNIKNTYEFSLSVPSNCPLIFHMNIAPSFEPAAMRLVSRLNETRDQSQLTLKLSLLHTHWEQKWEKKTKIQRKTLFVGLWTSSGLDEIKKTKTGRILKKKTNRSHYLNVFIIWFMRKSNNLIVSSRTQLSKYWQSFDRSNDVILPCSTISFAEQSVRVSQNRIFLS